MKIPLITVYALMRNIFFSCILNSRRLISLRKVIFGHHDEATLRQFENCLNTGNVVGGTLCADGHYGYSQPVGGVIVYDGQISPSGVGYDIACGNKAVKTNLLYADIKDQIATYMDKIYATIPFGVGKNSKLDRKSVV